MEWNQINTSDFLIFLSLNKISYPKSKVYTFGFCSEPKWVSDRGEQSEKGIFTDVVMQLPDCE